MTSQTIIGFINNTALLIALVFIYDVFSSNKSLDKSTFGKIILGCILGFIGVAIMMNPWEFRPGVIFDTRSVLLSISGFFFGTIPTLLAIIACSLYRLFIGGLGAWTGVATIVSSGLVGLAWRYWKKEDLSQASMGNLYTLGLVTHVVMLLLMLTLPHSIALKVLTQISIPVLVIFPLGTVLIGKLLINRLKHVKDTFALEESENKYRNLIESLQEGVWVIDKSNLTTFVNVPMADMLGYQVEEMIGKPLFSFMDEQGIAVANMNLERRRKGVKEQHEFEFLHKDGSRVYALIATTPIIDSNGDYNGAIAGVLDITERRSTELELRKSEEKFKHIFEAANVGKSITHPAGEIFVNKAFADLLGYSQEELKKKSWQDLTPREDIEQIQELVAPLLKGEKESASFDKRYLHRDGSIIWADVNTVIRRNNSGDPLYFITTLFDITKRKQTEKLLRLSEQRFFNAFNSSPAGMTITRIVDGKFIDANETFLRMFEFSREEVIGQTSTSLNMWTVEERKSLIQEQLESGGLDNFELQARSKSGKLLSIMFSSREMELDGESYHVTTMLDITEKKRAEANLIETENRYRSLFENMTAGFVLFEVIEDNRGKPVDLVIVVANKEFENTTGVKIQDAIGNRLTEVLPGIEKDAADWIGTYGNIALTGTPQQFEQGSELLGYYYSITAYQAGPKQCAVIFTDSTEQKKIAMEREKLQEQLQQAQKMESIGNLAGGVAHDYNNMLSVILGYTELALESTELPSSVHSDLEEVLNAARRSAEITRQLLAFARKETIEPTKLNLNDTIEAMLKMIRRLIGEDIDLTWLPKRDLWSVSMDPSQIDQILVNLCINARDAIADVGRITIETENISLDQNYCSEHYDTIPGDYVQLVVSDDGCGMEKDTIDKIFEPFFTTKISGKGTGMGLSSIYGIVKQNGGFINVYSELGEGTTFRIYLPRHEGKSEEKRIKQEPEFQPAQGETILVVEDEDSILQLCKRILCDLGYTVLTAQNPEDAISQVKEQETAVDLLITDVIMPKMNGRVLAERLQAIHPELRVLFMSGYTANVIAHHGILEKGIHFIAKPLSAQKLAAQVRETLDDTDS